MYDEQERIEYTALSRRRHISRRGVAWCGSNRAGHFIPKGLRYEKYVEIVEGEFTTWNLCDDCDADLRGYEMPDGSPVSKHRLHPRPEKQA